MKDLVINKCLSCIHYKDSTIKVPSYYWRVCDKGWFRRRGSKLMKKLSCKDFKEDTEKVTQQRIMSKVW